MTPLFAAVLVGLPLAKALPVKTGHHGAVSSSIDNAFSSVDGNSPLNNQHRTIIKKRTEYVLMSMDKAYMPQNCHLPTETSKDPCLDYLLKLEDFIEQNYLAVHLAGASMWNEAKAAFAKPTEGQMREWPETTEEFARPVKNSLPFMVSQLKNIYEKEKSNRNTPVARMGTTEPLPDPEKTDLFIAAGEVDLARFTRQLNNGEYPPKLVRIMQKNLAYPRVRMYTIFINREFKLAIKNYVEMLSIYRDFKAKSPEELKSIVTSPPVQKPETATQSKKSSSNSKSKSAATENFNLQPPKLEIKKMDCSVVTPRSNNGPCEIYLEKEVDPVLDYYRKYWMKVVNSAKKINDIIQKMEGEGVVFPKYIIEHIKEAIPPREVVRLEGTEAKGDDLKSDNNIWLKPTFSDFKINGILDGERASRSYRHPVAALTSTEDASTSTENASPSTEDAKDTTIDNDREFKAITLAYRQYYADIILGIEKTKSITRNFVKLVNVLIRDVPEFATAIKDGDGMASFSRINAWIEHHQGSVDTKLPKDEIDYNFFKESNENDILANLFLKYPAIRAPKQNKNVVLAKDKGKGKAPESTIQQMPWPTTRRNFDHYLKNSDGDGVDIYNEFKVKMVETTLPPLTAQEMKLPCNRFRAAIDVAFGVLHQLYKSRYQIGNPAAIPGSPGIGSPKSLTESTIWQDISKLWENQDITSSWKQGSKEESKNKKAENSANEAGPSTKEEKQGTGTPSNPGAVTRFSSHRDLNIPSDNSNGPKENDGNGERKNKLEGKQQ